MKVCVCVNEGRGGVKNAMMPLKKKTFFLTRFKIVFGNYLKKPASKKSLLHDKEICIFGCLQHFARVPLSKLQKILHVFV